MKGKKEMNLELIGKRLKEAREQKGMTLEQVGDLFEHNKTTIMRWENGETKKIPTFYLEKLTSIYDVNIEWLSGLGSAPKKKEDVKDSDIFIGLYQDEIKNLTEEQKEFIRNIVRNLNKDN